MIVVFHSFIEKSTFLGKRPYAFVSNQAFLPEVRSTGLAQSVVRLTVERVVAGSISGPDQTQIKITEKGRYSLCTASG